nr:hypothetical transcript [Hymenolepis microstoma]
MVEKEGYWVPHELKPSDVERRRFLLVNSCWKGKRERGTRTPERDAPEPCSRKKENGHSTTRTTIGLFYSMKVVKKYLEASYSPDVARSNFRHTHLAQWHTAWLTNTSARMKK